MCDSTVSCDTITKQRQPDVMCGPTLTGQPAVFIAIQEYVRIRDLHPAAFALSYREIDRRLGWGSPKRVWTAVQGLVKAGRLVILDNGSQGERGDKTIFGLVHSTPEEAIADGARRPATMKRRLKRAQHTAKISARVVPFTSRSEARIPARMSTATARVEGA
jgi:hypothetical protein